MELIDKYGNYILNKRYTEILELDKMLDEAEIPHTLKRSMDGWHITDLIVYDEPRELSDFKHECNGVCVDTKKQIKCERITVDGFSCNGLKPITRPPMSWQFCVATEPRQTAD